MPSSFAATALGGLLVLALAGCAQATATAAPTPTVPPVVAASPSILISIDGPAEVAAGKDFMVAWQGPVTNGDYIAIVPKGTRAYTGVGSYANTNAGNPVKLTAPATPGEYELWYLLGDTGDAIMARRPITVK